MHAIRFLKALAAITAAGLVMTTLATPSASMTSPPDETVALGDVYHLNRCVAARGEDEAILQVESEYGWLIVGKGPFVRDEDCAAANPKTPYTAPTATWEPTTTGTFAMRLQYGYGVLDVTSEPWAVQVTPGNPSKLTTIRYRVKGCSGCKIQPYRVTSGGKTYLEYPAVTVRGGKAESVVPRRRTRGMAFAVNARRWNPWNSVPLVITRYAVTSDGQRVGLGKALSARKGSFCWAGTDKKSATLKIRAKRFRYQPEPGFPVDGKSIFLWASPALKDFHAYRNMQPLTDHGHSFNGSPSC